MRLLAWREGYVKPLAPRLGQQHLPITICLSSQRPQVVHNFNFGPSQWSCSSSSSGSIQPLGAQLDVLQHEKSSAVSRFTNRAIGLSSPRTKIGSVSSLLKKSREIPQSTPGGNAPLVLDSSKYGHWQDLMLDFKQLVSELEFDSSQPDVRKLVDLPEHQNDVGLWAIILNFSQRRDSHDGALVVWKEVFKRRNLHQMDGAVAKAFWQTILKSALGDETFLESIWVYAEFLYSLHGVQWPSLYYTIVTFCLENSQYDRAVRWHMRLSPHFDLGRKQFFDLLKEHISDVDPDMQEALRSIYTTSAHRQLYDTIVPFLWSQGHSNLARSWRQTLIVQSDHPASRVARPFLKFLAGYFRDTQFTVEETSVKAEPKAQDMVNSNSSSAFYSWMNRVHGLTFGVREKGYNDKLGARWFASSWVSLDNAVQLVHALGVEEIGPLSLQSILLREPDLKGVKQRLQQLDGLNIGTGFSRHKISTGFSHYSTLVRHLADNDDFETLQDLLHSDLHPDVFEDLPLQRRLLGAASFSGDWKTCRIILAARVAISKATVAVAANNLLTTYLQYDRIAMVLKVMDEFDACGIEVFASTSHGISQFILDRIPGHFDSDLRKVDADFFIALSRRMATMHWPVATQAWQNILMILARGGRLDDVERLSLDLVDRYRSWQKSDQPAMKIHILDVPEVTREDSPYPFYLLPRDLYLTHAQHPLQLIFGGEYLRTVVQFSFLWMVLRRQSLAMSKQTSLDRPTDFHMGRGVRLLAMLRDKGVNINSQSLQNAVISAVKDIFGPRVVREDHQHKALLRNQYTIGEIKNIFDGAWGSELLPSVEHLKAVWSEFKEDAATLEGGLGSPAHRK